MSNLEFVKGVWDMSKESSNKEKYLFYGSIIFLFCYFFQLFGFTNSWALLGSGMILFFSVFLKRKIYINIREIILAASLLLYTGIAGFGTTSIISVTFLPVLFMAIGEYMVRSSVATEEKKLYWLLGVLVAGFTLHGILNSILYFKLGVSEGAGRWWIDIWTGIELPATHHNVYVLPILALTFPAFLFFRKYKWICGVILLSDFFLIMHSIYSFSRIPILIWGILLVFEFVLFVIFNRTNKELVNYLKKIGIVLLGCIFCVLVIIIGLSIWKNRNFVGSLDRDGGIIHNIRFKAQMNVIKQLFVYPFGGYQMDLCGLQYCHNVWLDIANASGLIPFFLMIIYTIVSCIDIINFLRNPYFKNLLKYIISGLYFAFVVYYMVEPALMADVKFFVPWTYINGLVYGCNIMSRKRKEGYETY